jgi:hypothetical protein
MFILIGLLIGFCGEGALKTGAPILRGRRINNLLVFELPLLFSPYLKNSLQSRSYGNNF